MKSIILYSSLTGNTKSVADAMASVNLMMKMNRSIYVIDLSMN